MGPSKIGTPTQFLKPPIPFSSYYVLGAFSVIVKSSRTFVWSSTVNTTVTWPRSPVCRGHSSTAGRGTVAGCAEAAAEDGDGGPGPTSRTRHPGPGSRIPRSRAMHRGRAPSSQHRMTTCSLLPHFVVCVSSQVTSLNLSITAALWCMRTLK